MLTKINDREIISFWDAVNKYQGKYFIMIITEIIDNVYRDYGYVIYTSDKRADLLEVPLDEYERARAIFCEGLPKESAPISEMSRMVYYD